MAATIFAVLASICALMALLCRWQLARTSHGTSRMAVGFPMMGFGLLCVVFAGIASLISQYG